MSKYQIFVDTQFSVDKMSHVKNAKYKFDILHTVKALTKYEAANICLSCTKKGVFFSTVKKDTIFSAAQKKWPFLFC